MSHNIQQKEKKNWSQCAWFPIYSSNVKKRRVWNFLFFFWCGVGNFLHHAKNLFVFFLSLSLVGVKNWLEIFTITMFCSKVVSVCSLSLSLSQFLSICFKKNSWFFIFMSQLGNPNNKDIRDIPGLAPPAMTRKLLWSAS